MRVAAGDTCSVLLERPQVGAQGFGCTGESAHAIYLDAQIHLRMAAQDFCDRHH